MPQNWLRYLFLITIITALFFASDAPVRADDIDDVLSLVNQERAAIGLSPLALHPALNTAALNHARDMFINDYFSHTGLNCSNPSTRIAATGYVYTLAGENIATGYKTPLAVMRAWMESPGHRANILHGSFVHMGLARVGDYWVQTFGQPGTGTGQYDPACLSRLAGQMPSLSVLDATSAANEILIEVPPLAAGLYLNDLDAPAAPIAIFCNGTGPDSGLSIWRYENDDAIAAISLSGQRLAREVSAAIGGQQNRMFATTGNISLWALSTGEFQVQYIDPMTPDYQYAFIFPATICGNLLPAG